MTIALARAPRQLDIIADTALAADPRLAVHTASSTVGKHTASSTVARLPHPQIVEANKARERDGQSHPAFCRLIGIEINNWHKLRRGEQQPSPATLQKLDRARQAPKIAKPAQVIAAFHRLLVGLVADAMGEPRARVFAADMSKQRPQDPVWLRAVRIQMMATYIAAVELQVGNAELGRALGQSRQAVQKARNKVEDLRDDTAIDAALNAVTAQVTAP